MRVAVLTVALIVGCAVERESGDSGGDGIMTEGVRCQSVVSAVRDECGFERTACFRFPEDINGNSSQQCAEARSCEAGVIPNVSEACQDLLDHECVDRFEEQRAAWEEVLGEEYPEQTCADLVGDS